MTKVVQEGLGSALRRATGAKSTLGAIGAAAATIGATTAAGALAGGSTFAGPGAVIAGTYATASILNRMRKRRKMTESEIQNYFENWELLMEARRRKSSLGGLLIRGVARGLFGSVKSTRQQAQRKTLSKRDNDTVESKPTFHWRDPKTGQVTAQRKAEIASFNARQLRKTPEAKRAAHDEWMKHYNQWLTTPQARQNNNKTDQDRFLKKKPVTEGVLGDWLKAKRRKSNVADKLNDEASTKRIKSRVYSGISKKSAGQQFKDHTDKLSAKFASRANQLDRRKNALNKPKKLKYMGSK